MGTIQADKQEGLSGAPKIACEIVKVSSRMRIQMIYSKGVNWGRWERAVVCTQKSGREDGEQESCQIWEILKCNQEPGVSHIDNNRIILFLETEEDVKILLNSRQLGWEGMDGIQAMETFDAHEGATGTPPSLDCY